MAYAEIRDFFFLVFRHYCSFHDNISSCNDFLQIREFLFHEIQEVPVLQCFLQKEKTHPVVFLVVPDYFFWFLFYSYQLLLTESFF